jgi:hypothetical protein
MTFEEFKQHCTRAVSTNQPVLLPCPIIIGDGDITAAYGDTINHQIVIFNTPPDNADLREIVRSVRFSFESGTNEVVISKACT